MANIKKPQGFNAQLGAKVGEGACWIVGVVLTIWSFAAIGDDGLSGVAGSVLALLSFFVIGLFGSMIVRASVVTVPAKKIWYLYWFGNPQGCYWEGSYWVRPWAKKQLEFPADEQDLDLKFTQPTKTRGAKVEMVGQFGYQIVDAEEFAGRFPKGIAEAEKFLTGLFEETFSIAASGWEVEELTQADKERITKIKKLIYDDNTDIKEQIRLRGMEKTKFTLQQPQYADKEIAAGDRQARLGGQQGAAYLAEIDAFFAGGYRTATQEKQAQMRREYQGFLRDKTGYTAAQGVFSGGQNWRPAREDNDSKKVDKKGGEDKKKKRW